MARSKKTHIPAKEKLAAALLMCMQPDASGKLVRVISHEEAKRLTAKQIIARFHFHHWPIEEQDGGPALAWNLSPMPAPEHMKETGKLRTQRAKGKRIREKYNTTAPGSGFALPKKMPPMTAAIFGLLKDGTRPKPKRKGRPMPGGKASPHKRTMRGKTVPRHQPEAPAHA